MPVVLDTNSKYCVQIEQFEGPLDLLLHLVREAKLDPAVQGRERNHIKNK